MKRKIEIKEPFYRTIPFDRSAANDTARTVRLSISSDVPYLRQDFFGEPYYEVLDHSPGGIVSDRLESGTALLFNHDTGQHLGRNIDFKNDGHKCTVVSKFSRSVFAEEKWQDVQDGILVDSSVGYAVIDVEELDQEIDGIPIYKMKWEPLEASLVTVPADFTVGVGRSAELLSKRNKTMETQIENTEQNGRTATQERERIEEIRFMANMPTFKPLVTEAEVKGAIDGNVSKGAFQKMLVQRLAENCHPIQTPTPSTRLMGGEESRGISERILEHPEFRKILEGGRKTVSFTIPGVRSFREALTRINVTANVGTTVQQLPSVQGVAYEQLTVADLLAPGTTTSGKITYPRENSFSTDATTVPETGLKPEQAFDLVPDEASAKKIAAHTKISDELLQDSPAAADYINNRLGFAVLKQEDLQILRGDGLGSNMRGILSTPGVQTRPRGADTAPDAIRKAINDVDTSTDFMVTGIVLNPTDWMNIELLKDTTGRYLVGQILVPDEFGRPRLAPSLWGKPVAVSKSQTVGSALVGAFRTASQLFRRTGLLIESTNSNEDDFKRNLIMIRAELRAALAVYCGSAFCEVTGLP
jgi:HK97 family phage major capsid protein